MNKRALIIKDSTTSIKVKSSHLETTTSYETQYIGFENIYGVYISQDLSVSIKELITLAKHLPVYLTTPEGKLLAKVSLQV